MLALYIIGGIILIIVILLNCPASVFLKYEDGQFSAKVKYLFFTLYPRKVKEAAEDISADAEKALEPDSVSDSDSEEEGVSFEPEETPAIEMKLTKEELKEKKKTERLQNKKLKKRERLLKKREKVRKKEELLEKIALVKRIIASSGKGLRRILRGIRFKDLYLRLDVAEEDAAECAVKYGKIGAAVYDGLSFLRTFFTVSVEKIELNCRYYTDRGDCAARGTITLRPATLLNAALGIGMRFLILTLKERKQNGKEDLNERTPNSRNDGNNNGKNP